MEAWLWEGVSSFAYIWVSQVHEGISSYNNDILCQVMWPGWAVFFSSVLHPTVCHLTLHGAQCVALLKIKHSKIVFEFKLQRCNFNEIYKCTICHISFIWFVHKHFLLEKSCTLAGPYNMAERWKHVLHWVKL